MCRSVRGLGGDWGIVGVVEVGVEEVGGGGGDGGGGVIGNRW